MKICSKCKVEKPLNEFGKDCIRKNGKIYRPPTASCKQCKKNYDKKYNYENRQRRSERCKIYYLNNKGKFRGYSKKYKISSKEKLTDNYIKGILCNGSVLQFKDIPSELIELKRLQIQLIRKKKELKNG